MQQSHVHSFSGPAARKLGVTGSLSVCDVNNDRTSHWLRFYVRSPSVHNKPNGLQIQASIIYLLDHWRQTFRATVLGLQMLGQHIGKITLRVAALIRNIDERTLVALNNKGPI